jgi:CYTH domain-containing protein
MAVEIERKFLVRSEAWRSLVTTEARIRQAYLASGERSTTRVRIKNGTDAAVTIKSKRAELRRLEIECQISVLDAETLLSLRHSGLIEKTRFIVPWREHRWEVDVFSGAKEGGRRFRLRGEARFRRVHGSNGARSPDVSGRTAHETRDRGSCFG